MIDENSRFRGSVRHYHRAASTTEKNWDQWVNGSAAGVKISRNWPKILLITIGVIALAAIIIGLFIELR